MHENGACNLYPTRDCIRCGMWAAIVPKLVHGLQQCPVMGSWAGGMGCNSAQAGARAAKCTHAACVRVCMVQALPVLPVFVLLLLPTELVVDSEFGFMYNILHIEDTGDVSSLFFLATYIVFNKRNHVSSRQKSGTYRCDRGFLKEWKMNKCTPQQSDGCTSRICARKIPSGTFCW